MKNEFLVLLAQKAHSSAWGQFVRHPLQDHLQGLQGTPLQNQTQVL